MSASAEETKRMFREDGITHRIAVEARDMAKAAMQGCKNAMKALTDRGPDPGFAENDEDMRTLIKAFVELARRPSQGPGSVNGTSKLINWLVTLNIAVTVAAASWVASTLIEQGKDISVIKCQLNPSGCPQVVIRGR